jgi:DNA-binding Lrp family transcriptional regulator
MENLDNKDLQILDLLQRNSNYSVKEIGEKIGLSFTPTYERIKHLEKNGTIEKYAAVLNRKKIGVDLVAYCNVTIRNQSKKSLDEFEQEIVKYEEVQEVLSLSGTYDFMLKIATKNIDSYNNFITNVLANTPNIYQYHSSTENQSAQSMQTSLGELRVGQNIQHERFGMGEVTKLEGSGDNAKATIRFRHAGEKQLLLRFARFTVID